MSTQAFPTLKGLGWSVTRTPIWQTRQQDSVSGKRLNIADWSMPKHQWQLTYNFLRGQGPTYSEQQQLEAFFYARYGSFDSFLYTDPDDNAVSLSTLGSGDSTDRTWQLGRQFGSSFGSSIPGIFEKVLAPTAVSAVLVGSTALTSTQYAWAPWGTTTPGILTFSSFAPPAGQGIVASFAYAWPVSFDDDKMSFEQFVKKIWQLQKVAFTSQK